jgi:acyl carrier protein phosphodiesterase
LNFLAHVFLSGNDDEVMIGNFIADFVKGRKKDDYPPRIKSGIELHRAIDDFTDHHPLTSKSKDRLRHKYHKYSGVIVDIYYDHFLAKDFDKYSLVPLEEFSAKTYVTISAYTYLLPEKIKGFLPFMIERNWLLNYREIEGIGRTLSGLSRRVNFENRMDEAITELISDYNDFHDDFNGFFPELITFAGGFK